MTDLDLLRSRIASLGQSGRGRRYPADLRDDIVAAVRVARSKGTTAAELEQALGVPWNTMSRWVTAVGMARVIVPVHVRPVERRSPTLVSPTGWRIEGLTLEELRLLLNEP